jgi:sterol 14alpha-demethylase
VTAVPTLAGGLPWLGHAVAFGRDPVGLLERGRALHGDVFRFGLLGRTVYALLSPRGQEAFFRAPDDQLSAREAYRFTVPIFGDGVAYAVSSELMDEQLRLLFPALRDDAMQSYAAYMADEVERFAERLGPAGEIELLPAMNELTIFIAGRCLIGPEFRSRVSAEFAALYRELEGGINLVAFLSPRFPSPANLRRDRARRRVAALMAALIAERRRTRAAQDDFLGVLMAARYKDGTALSDEAITGLLLTALFAGQHTSAVMATWLGVLLLQHPEQLALLRREAAGTIGGGPPRLAALKRLQLFEQCLKETERLHPPLVMLMRMVRDGFAVDGVALPAGSLALVSPAVGHRLPEIFAEPERFDPGRFAPPREEDRATPFSLIGFGGGKHRCIGLAFAHQQIKVIWTLLLRRFDFELIDPAPPPDYTTFVVGPRAPCRLRYRARSAIEDDFAICRAEAS